MKKYLILASIILLAAACHKQAINNGNSQNNGPITAQGKVVCAPDDVPPGSITKENCRVGLQTSDGVYYLLTNTTLTPDVQEIAEVQGDFTSQPGKYVNIKGIINVKSQKIISGNPNWNSYQSPDKYGFSIKYPKDFGFNTDYNQVKSLSYIAVCDQTMVACLFLNKDDYKATNFDGAGISINILGLNDDRKFTEQQCYNFSSSASEAQTVEPPVTINGVEFETATGSGGAAGHSDKLRVYRNFHNNMCYEITQGVVQTNMANYPAGTVQQFDENAVWEKLQGVVDTFEFTGATTALKTYKNNEYKFQLSYPAQYELSLIVANKQGTQNYDQFSKPDSTINQLNENLPTGTADTLYVEVEEISYVFPKDLAEACAQQGRPVTEGIKCLNAGSDAGPGATQDFMLKERDALESSQAGGDFNYFDYSPWVSVPNAFAFHKTTGRVLQVGQHKVYVYAELSYQSASLNIAILAFDKSGNMISISYNPSQFNLSHQDTEFSHLKPSDVTSTGDWATAINIAQSLQIH